MDYTQIMGLIKRVFPSVDDSISQAKGMINGVEDSIDGVKGFLKMNNITNEQIDKVANFIQTHPMGKMMGNHPTIIASKIRELKGSGYNTNRSLAPALELPVQKQRRVSKF